MLDQYIKYAKNKKEFIDQAEKYFVNMTSAARKLHITGCKSCQYSTYATQFITFASIEEVEIFEKNHRHATPFIKCMKCFQ